jgi:hypothetical protein
LHYIYTHTQHQLIFSAFHIGVLYFFFHELTPSLFSNVVLCGGRKCDIRPFMILESCLMQKKPTHYCSSQHFPFASKFFGNTFFHITFPPLIQVDLGGQPPFPLNQHSKPMVLLNHDIHSFDGEWNVILSSFVNYRHHVMIF